MHIGNILTLKPSRTVSESARISIYMPGNTQTSSWVSSSVMILMLCSTVMFWDVWGRTCSVNNRICGSVTNRQTWKHTCSVCIGNAWVSHPPELSCCFIALFQFDHSEDHPTPLRHMNKNRTNSFMFHVTFFVWEKKKISSKLLTPCISCWQFYSNKLPK